MRRVQVFKMESQESNGVFRHVRVPDYSATFHNFAQEADGEGQSNPVAIVERDDGTVETVYCHMIQFIDRAIATKAAA